MNLKCTISNIAGKRYASLNKRTGDAATAFKVTLGLSTQPGVCWLRWYEVAVGKSVLRPPLNVIEARDSKCLLKSGP